MANLVKTITRTVTITETVEVAPIPVPAAPVAKAAPKLGWRPHLGAKVLYAGSRWEIRWLGASQGTERVMLIGGGGKLKMFADAKNVSPA